MRNLWTYLTRMLCLLAFATITRGQSPQDWPDLTRYRADDVRFLDTPAADENRVVFLGDSITELWAQKDPKFFHPKLYLNRGISGQTTPQMLLRFRQDVIDLQPRVVVILAGINDIAGNTGPSTPKMIQDNLMSMAQLAKANGIKVVLASITPADHFYWNSGIKPAHKIAVLNAWIKEYAAKSGFIYLDYYSLMADPSGAMKQELTNDGVHPNANGYAVMEPLVEEAIATALVE
jgi:lysophospholipase L1-like esterase